MQMIVYLSVCLLYKQQAHFEILILWVSSEENQLVSSPGIVPYLISFLGSDSHEGRECTWGWSLAMESEIVEE